MWDIFKFLFKPSDSIENLMTKENKFKIIIISVLILIYSLSTVLVEYFGLMSWLFDTSYYIQLFFYNVWYYIIFILIVWGIWKIFRWKSKYLDILLVTMLSIIPFIIVNVLLIIFLLINSLWLLMMSMFFSIPALIWFLIIWSKWLSKVEELSEWKITLIVILSLVAIYYLNSYLTWITWFSFL